MLNQQLLAARLREARKNKGLSQDEAALKTGMSRLGLIQAEAGTRILNAAELINLARLYEVPVAGLLPVGDNEDPVQALFRMRQDIHAGSAVGRSVTKLISLCACGARLKRLLRTTTSTAPPKYDLPAPRSMAEAVKQGQEVAKEERRRLNLGIAPIPDMAELLSAQGIWAAAAEVPDDVAGLFLNHETIGLAVVVNQHQPRGRRRFSYAHEFAHVLLDRASTFTITATGNANDLIEKRANAFAGAFLVPVGGVDDLLARLGKSSAARESFWLWDSARNAPDHVQQRSDSRSWQIGVKDVAYIAHHFRVSYETAAFRLLDLEYVRRNEVQNLIERAHEGRTFIQALNLFDPDEEVKGKQQPYLKREIALLALEAARREEISRSEFGEICQLVDLESAADQLLLFE